MPLAFLVVGALLIVVAVRDTYSQLGTLLVGDFTGSGGGTSFLVWAAAIVGIGSLGYVPALKTPSRMLLALVIVALFIANKGFFANFTQALGAKIPGVTVTAATSTPVESQLPAAIPVQVTGTSASSGASGAAGAAATATSALKAIPLIGGLF